MEMRTLSVQMVLVLAATSALARADAPPVPQVPPPPSPPAVMDGEPFDPAGMRERHQAAELALFDALRADSSPRLQALAHRFYIDPADRSPMRPLPDEVLARASELAPDDALVQWLAASAGKYTSSSCGPTTWPDQEVANLVRLEPDNAAARQFEVALAQARNEPDALDQALSRMATATRADDHLGDELGAWTKALTAYPTPSPYIQIWDSNDAPPEASALLAALSRTAFRYSSTSSALKTACGLDAQSDATWQRLGWCADIGRLLANEGSSLALREQGLELLAAIGDRSDATASAQRQLDWLKAHDAHPLRNFKVMQEPPADMVADWVGAPNEIAAIERRLRRLGEPLNPPDGWSGKDDEGDASDEETRAMDAHMAFVNGLLADMRSSSDLHERALAASVEDMFPPAPASTSTLDAAPASTPATEETDLLVSLAAANPDDLLTQWTLATRDDQEAEVKAAIASVQRLDPDNAAAWMLSLGSDATGDLASLQRMANAKRYDTFRTQIMRIWLAAIERQPSAAMTDVIDAIPIFEQMSNDHATKMMAVMMAQSDGAKAMPLVQACSTDNEAHKSVCIPVARRLLHEGAHVLDTMIGKAVLKKLDAMDAADTDRSRHIAWWTARLVKEGPGAYNSELLDDHFRSGNEIEALQRAAERAGESEPPADWKPRGWE